MRNPAVVVHVLPPTERTPFGKFMDCAEKHIGVRLPVTNVKDFGMIAIFDDRAIGVVLNTGELVGGEEATKYVMKKVA